MSSVIKDWCLDFIEGASSDVVFHVAKKVCKKATAICGMVGLGVITEHFILRPLRQKFSRFSGITVEQMLLVYCLLEASNLPEPVVRSSQLVGSGIVLARGPHSAPHIISTALMLAAPVAARDVIRRTGLGVRDRIGAMGVESNPDYPIGGFPPNWL